MFPFKQNSKLDLYTSRRSQRTGRIDGRGWKAKYVLLPFIKDRHNTPEPRQSDNKELTSFEKQIVIAATDDVHRIELNWIEKDNKLKSKFCEKASLYLHAKYKLEEERSEVTEPEVNFKNASEFLKSVDDPPRLNHFIAILIIVIISIIEYPLNSTIFQLFAENKLFTYLFALIPSLSLGFGAHFLGMILKQKDKDRNDWLFLVVIPIMFFGLLFGFSYIRSKFLGYAGHNLPSELQLNEDSRTWIFYLLNIVLFVLATWISFLGSRENLKIYKRAKKNYNISKKSLKKESGEALSALEQYNRFQIEFQKSKNARENEYNLAVTKLKQKIRDAEYFIEHYREANGRARRENRLPSASWGSIPMIDLPLKHLNWHCTNIDSKYESDYIKILKETNKINSIDSYKI